MSIPIDTPGGSAWRSPSARGPAAVCPHQAAWARSAIAVVMVLLLAPAAWGDRVAEVVIPLAPPRPPPLTAQEKQRVQQAVERGVVYLRRTQLPTGSWVLDRAAPEDFTPTLPPHYMTGVTALGGLALLESGVPAADPAVQAAARCVRLRGPHLFRTYEVSLALLFLDRLADKRDLPLLRTLALRLAAGQTNLGGWTYNCPLLSKTQQKRLEQALAKKSRADLPKQLRPLPPADQGWVRSSDPADNSNTQFAILALGAARRHGLPLDYTLGLLEQRFRLSENATGWEYQWWVWGRPKGYGSMTCVGLLALAVGRAAAEEEAGTGGKGEQERPEDGGIAWGLKLLGAYLHYPSDTGFGGRDPSFGPPGALNLYFYWSVERVGVLCGVDTIGGTDWYRWGASLLVPAQRADGSWRGRGSGGYPAVDTCFALLFLKRSDLLPELRKALPKRVRIVDPGPFAQGGLPVAKGQRPNPAIPGAGRVPVERAPASSGAKGAAEPPGPMLAELGAVQAGQDKALPLRVRGPEPFRIKAVRGTDEHLKVEGDTDSAKVHELTVTLRLDKAGPFERMLVLETDLPGQHEVALHLRARVTAPPHAGRKTK